MKILSAEKKIDRKQVGRGTDEKEGTEEGVIVEGRSLLVLKLR